MQVAHLNPAETAHFQAKYAALPADHQADTALAWRERAVNAVRAANPEVGTTAATAALAVAFTGAVGWWDGANEFKRNEAIRVWREETAPSLDINTDTHETPFKTIVDPTTKAVIHTAVSDPRSGFWSLAPTLGAAALSSGLTWRGHLRLGRVAGGMAMAAGGYWAGSMARDMAYARAAAAAKTAAQTPATPADNPNRNYGGYPRAA